MTNETEIDWGDYLMSALLTSEEIATVFGVTRQAVTTRNGLMERHQWPRIRFGRYYLYPAAVVLRAAAEALGIELAHRRVGQIYVAIEPWRPQYRRRDVAVLRDILHPPAGYASRYGTRQSLNRALQTADLTALWLGRTVCYPLVEVQSRLWREVEVADASTPAG